MAVLPQNNARINKIDEHSQSALFWACLQGTASVSKYLLDTGANPTSVTTQKSSLIEAVFQRQENTYVFFKELGMSDEHNQRCHQQHQAICKPPNFERERAMFLTEAFQSLASNQNHKRKRPQ